MTVAASSALMAALWVAPAATTDGKAATTATTATTDAFDHQAAWGEFVTVLRGDYAYLEREDFDVDAHLARVRAAAFAATDAHAFRRVLHAGTWAFTDPHLLVGPLDDDEPNVWPTSGDIVVDADGVVVDVRAGSPAAAGDVVVGDVIVHIDGVALADAQRALLSLTPKPTKAQLAYAATVVVNGKRDGKARALSIRRAKNDSPLIFRQAENPRAFAKAQAALAPLSVRRDGGVAIIRFNNSLGRRETIAAVDAAAAEVQGASAVIIDLRNTPSGGNTDVARAIIGHFVDDVVPYQVHEIPAVLRATTVPRRFVEMVFPRALRVRAPLYVLGGHWTGSMGEGLVIGLDAAAGAVTIASEMGDLLGALSSTSLPACGGFIEARHRGPLSCQRNAPRRLRRRRRRVRG